MSCICFNQLVDGCIGQPVIDVLGGGAASCSLLASLGFFVCFAFNFTIERLGRALHPACFRKTAQPALRRWLGNGRRAPTFGWVPHGCRAPPLAPALLLAQASRAFHNPEQELLGYGRGACSVLFVSLHRWDQISALTLNSAHVLTLQTPTSPRSCQGYLFL